MKWAGNWVKRGARAWIEIYEEGVETCNYDLTYVDVMTFIVVGVALSNWVRARSAKFYLFRERLFEAIINAYVIVL